MNDENVAEPPREPLDPGKVRQIVHDELRCMTCGTAAYVPNDRCKAHISCKDALDTERTLLAAWQKRAYEAEVEIERLKSSGGVPDTLKAEK